MLGYNKKKKIHYWKPETKYYCFVLLFLLSFFAEKSLHASQRSSELKSIRVGVYNNYPKIFINNRHKPAGIFIDIVSYIAKQEDWKVEYVYGDWQDLTAMLKENKIDVLPDVAYSVERDSIFTLNSFVFTSLSSSNSK